MTAINRTIVVSADSRYLTQRVIEVLDSAGIIPQSVQQAAASAAEAAGSAQEAQQALAASNSAATQAGAYAQTAAADAAAAQAAAQDAQGASLYSADLPALLSSTTAHPVGTVFNTRREGYSYIVVASGGALVTAGGVFLDPVQVDGIRLTPQQFGARGDGLTDDTAAWTAFQAAVGQKQVPPGRYLVSGTVKRFDLGALGNGSFDDATASWDQPTGDRNRDTLLMHRRDLNANATLVSPAIKTQTRVTFQVDVPSGSFKHVVGAYHEATLEGYYNTRDDTNQNFTVFGASVLNKMAGLFGSLAFTGRAVSGRETDNARIATMGAPKQGVFFAETRHNTKHENGGYSFNYEGYLINGADETAAIPYANNDEYSFLPWTTNAKFTGGGNSPISSAILMHGLGGTHGYYNGIVLGASMWRVNNDTQGPAGTVGINLASWRSSLGYADVGIKWRTANRHTYFREGHKSRASLTRFMHELGPCGIAVEAASGENSYMHFKRGVTSAPDGGTPFLSAQIDATSSWFRLQSNEGEVHLSPTGALYAATSARFAPGTDYDGTLHLGGANRRWNTVYATTSAISTSDQRAKQDIADIPDAVLDAWGDVQWRGFRFREAVAEKGEAARRHSGLIAQRVMQVFADHGLDAAEWGLLCYDEWAEEPEKVEEYQVEITPAVYEQILVREATFKTVTVKNEDGSITESTVEDQPAEYRDGEMLTPAVVETHRSVVPAVEANSLYGIRYEEALCMEAAYQRRRADLADARFEALEARISALEHGAA